jgi:hypothetical protein
MNEIVANKDMVLAQEVLAVPAELIGVSGSEDCKVFIDSPEATSAEEPVEAVN